MGRKNNFKKEKLEEKILEEINDFLRRNVSDSRLKMTSISKVELGPDLSHAKVFWDTYNPALKTEAEKAFEGVTGKVRSFLGGKLSIRHIPSITFFYDNRYDAEKSITDLLDKEMNGDDDGHESDEE